MKIKSFSFGFGLGIIFVSIIFIVIYNNYSDKVVNNEVVENEISDKEVISRAEELGMAFYINLSDKAKIMSELSTELDTSINKEITAKTEEDNINGDIEKSTENIVTQAIDAEKDNINGDIEKSTESVVTQAIDVEKDDINGDVEKSTENVVTQAIDAKDDDVIDSSNEADTTENDVNKVTIKIDSGTDAATISEMLKDAGIIDNADEYLNYIIDNNEATKIIAGTYQFTNDMSYKEITDTITR